jgi:hypothetical protein
MNGRHRTEIDRCCKPNAGGTPESRHDPPSAKLPCLPQALLQGLVVRS